MKPCLVDANVFIALLVERHQHHKTARAWFSGLEAGEARMCRLVHLALLRLLGTEAVMGRAALHPYDAWTVIGTLMQDERVLAFGEPPGVDRVLSELLKVRTVGSKTINDAYLAATAIRLDWRLASFDKGMRQFRDLDLQLL